MKMAKNVDGFLAAHWPKYGVQGNFKGPINGGWKGAQPPRHPRNLGIQWPAHAIWWVAETCCKT